ncbi:hypothetical protein [Cellulomonas cellasea]|uniref:Uncharacterized protein n=1 Tax=Cellulomonas cellasea TaxID=43670 RepID=A0A7W4UFW1_9CELL|nr:hypothetical protein [Cellulomonas cellasea]MBB2923372.1 hypothetical protein [Cellulomonas cellasea]
MQRAPYGLDTRASQGAYVGEAVRLWTAQPTMSLTDFAEALLKTITARLTSAGVPRIRWKVGPGADADGTFDSKAWMIRVNTSSFSAGTPPPTTLGGLTKDEVTAVVGTLYHEARHADQDVLVIRDLLAKKKTVDQVVALTEMPVEVVRAVKARTYPAALDADQRAHAGRMFDVMYGAHKQFLQFLVKHSAAWAGLDRFAGGATVAETAPHVARLTAWQGRELQPHLGRLSALPKRTAMEADLFQRLQTVDAALTTFRGEWRTVARGQQPDEAQLDAAREEAAAARDAILATYKSLESEADAFRVEAAVAAAFTAKLAKP